MSIIRKILYPVSVLYGEVTKLRNLLYDKGIFKSTRFKTPIIVVGNLNVGGTGKSPQIEYLIQLLQNSFHLATLSRGYKRKSNGFIIASKNSNAQELGDEPFQFYRKFPTVVVSVGADRVAAIKELKKLEHPPEIILLDDAFQHRKVAAGFTILLTSYDNLYMEDKVLPTGNLREKVEGASRANIIIVTKCPANLLEEEQFEISKKVNATLYQTVFFTSIAYNDTLLSNSETLDLNTLENYEIILVTGIAKPKPLLDYLESKKLKVHHLKFSDHHNFSSKDISKIEKTYASIASKNKIVLTTEKDFVRIPTKLEALFYIEIQTKFIDHQEDFDKIILNYISKSLKEGLK